MHANTGPFEGDVVNGVPRSNPNDPRIACPRGTTKVGYYHTHLDGVNFSENDMYSLGPKTYPYYMAQNKNEIKKAIPMRTDNPKVSGDPLSARGTLIAPAEIISLKLKNSSLELEE